MRAPAGVDPLRRNLPRLWALVLAGRVPTWRARGVAEATIHATPALTADAAAYVDAQVAAVAGKVGTARAGGAAGTSRHPNCGR